MTKTKGQRQRQRQQGQRQRQKDKDKGKDKETLACISPLEPPVLAWYRGGKFPYWYFWTEWPKVRV